MKDDNNSKAYLRLRLHVEEGNISVAGARTVEGPLTTSDKFSSKLAYEVTIGSKRIATGSIPDVGVNRSFPNPDGSETQTGHYFVELPSYEFDVRIPREVLPSRSSLTQAEIALYRIKGTAKQSISSDNRLLLQDQFRGELREVGRLKGIPIKKLPKSVQAEISRFFR
jgi:hypothetical protein